MFFLKKEWYETWWGIILCILFFYVLIPYLVWAKTNWNKNLKIGITVICFLTFLGGIIIYISETITDNRLTKEAVKALNKGDIDKATSLIEKVNEATNLKEDIKEAKQLNFIYELGRLTDSEYEALKNNNLNKKYFNSEEVNKYVINKIKSIEDKREEAKIILAQKIFQNKTENLIKEAKNNLEKYLKRNYLKDPNSYQHINTEAIKTTGDDNTITIKQEFIAKNSFGANTRTVCLAMQNINTGNFTNLQCGN